MSSIKKEEKLKRKAEKKKRKSLKKLKKLAKKIAKKSDTTIIQLEIPSANSSQFKQAANQAILNAINELSESFEPTLSWVDGDSSGKVKQLKTPNSMNRAKAPVSKPTSSAIPAINVPYKSPACKRCPALAKGLCKCAMKRVPKSA